ncbi:MAG TPA: TetR/AcrR family transcriptional regulator [Candidatus Acidoferrum sp.]|nr:TetR/AcrR family transcriptional regulator [Candidatus Acidoferrum sp.]
MGRPKNFSREGVLEKVLPVFWKHGFADTSLQDLEKATGVNKSGLYAEFADKGDLYLESLRYYLRKRQKEELLTTNPLGWKNIERFLKVGPCSLEGQKGCFSVNSMNQFALLPPAAQEIVEKSCTLLKVLIAKNVEAETSAMKPTVLAEMILTFFTGISMEQHLRACKASMNRKVGDFMKAVRKL